MEDTHSCIPPLRAIMCCMYTVYSGMQEWVIQIHSIPILVSVLFPSLHLDKIFVMVTVYVSGDGFNPLGPKINF